MFIFTVYFYSGCLCLETLSLILSIVVINMSKRVYCKPLPRNIRLCLLSWPGKLLGLSDLISVVINVLKLKIIFIIKNVYIIYNSLSFSLIFKLFISNYFFLLESPFYVFLQFIFDVKIYKQYKI